MSWRVQGSQAHCLCSRRARSLSACRPARCAAFAGGPVLSCLCAVRPVCCAAFALPPVCHPSTDMATRALGRRRSALPRQLAPPKPAQARCLSIRPHMPVVCLLLMLRPVRAAWPVLRRQRATACTVCVLCGVRCALLKPWWHRPQTCGASRPVQEVKQRLTCAILAAPHRPLSLLLFRCQELSRVWGIGLGCKTYLAAPHRPVRPRHSPSNGSRQAPVHLVGPRRALGTASSRLHATQAVARLPCKARGTWDVACSTHAAQLQAGVSVVSVEDRKLGHRCHSFFHSCRQLLVP
jgi:hypothetical protein